jgi:hypothetical protein
VIRSLVIRIEGTQSGSREGVLKWLGKGIIKFNKVVDDYERDIDGLIIGVRVWKEVGEGGEDHSSYMCRPPVTHLLLTQ